MFVRNWLGSASSQCSKRGLLLVIVVKSQAGSDDQWPWRLTTQESICHLGLRAQLLGWVVA